MEELHLILYQMTGVHIFLSHQREICLEVSEICDIICFPPIILVKLEI